MLGLCLAWFILYSALPALAEHLYVASGESLHISGSHTYETGEIYGTVLLDSDASLTFTWGLDHPDSTSPALRMGSSSRFRWVHYSTSAADGVEGSVGTTLGDPATDGTPGENGLDGPSLTLTVHGDMVLEGSAYVYLGGQAGGDGGAGGKGYDSYNYAEPYGTPGADGANGAPGGRGGKGGSLTLTVNGEIRSADTSSKYFYVYANGGSGGDGGGGGAGGHGRFGESCAGDPSCGCSPGGDGGEPGLAASGIEGASGGDIKLFAQNMTLVKMYAYTRGGDGGGGGAGGDGGNGGPGGWGDYDPTPGVPGDTVYCCAANGAGTPASAGQPGAPGGPGGRIDVTVGCSISQATQVLFSSYGGTGGDGGKAGEAGWNAASVGSCPAVDGRDGIDGAAGGQGGHGGMVTASGAVLEAVALRAKGGDGGAGGQGGAGSQGTDHTTPLGVDGESGNGGRGGDGGPGGYARLEAKTHTEGSSYGNAVDGGDAGQGGEAGEYPYDPGEHPVGEAGADGSAGVDGTTDTIELPADHSGFAVGLQASLDRAMAGEQLVYTVTARNGDTTQTNCSVNLPIPAQVSLVSASGEPTLFGGTLIWTIPSMGSCQTKSYTVVVGLSPALAQGDEVTATATAASDQSSPVPCSATTLIYEGPGTVDPESLKGPQGDNVRDPVSPATGNLNWGRDLLTLPNPGVPLIFAVFYNSADAGQDGPLGHGWNHSYNTTLSEDGATGRVTITWGNGARSFFDPDGEGGYTPVSCVSHATLAPAGDGFAATYPSGLAYAFDADGLLSTISDRNGNFVDLSYTTGQLAQVIDSVGRQVTLTYSGGRITDVDGPLSSFAFTYDGNGDLTGWTDALGHGPAFTYDASHRMLTRSNARGQVVATNTYDGQGRVDSQADAWSRATTFTYTAEDQLTKVVVTPPSGHAVENWYDAAYNLVKVKDGEGGEASFSYQGLGRKTGSQDKLGVSTTREFNDAGQVTWTMDRAGGIWQRQFNDLDLPTSLINPEGGTISLEYDAAGNLLTQTGLGGERTTTTYNAAGQPLVTTDPVGGTWQHTYDAVGLPATSTTPDSQTTGYTFDLEGRLTQVDHPTPGASVSLTYDAAGRLASHTDALGQVTSFTLDEDGNATGATFAPLAATTTRSYDAYGRVTSITGPLGGVWSYTYDQDGNLASMTDPDGVGVTFAFDQANRITRRTYDDGGYTSYDYDANGRLTAYTDRAGRTTTYAYGPDGRPASATMPSGAAATFTYDALGRLTAQTDETGRVTSQSYDQASNLVEKVLPGGRTIAYDYDKAGRLTAYTDPRGNGWAFAYSQGYLTQITDPLGHHSIYTHDEMGRVEGLTDRKSQSFAYAYDLGGRLTTLTLPDTSTITYTHHASGNLASATGTLGSLAWVRDKQGRATSFTNQDGKAVGYAFTPAGRLDTITYPGSHDLTHTYDAAGRISTISDWAGHTTTFIYGADGQVARVDLPGGVSTLYGRDQDGRMVSLTHQKSGGEVIASYALTLDAAGRVTQEDRTEPAADALPAQDAGYTFSAANRLSTAEVDGAAATYTHDLNGNLTQVTLGGADTDLVYDALNRLTSYTLGGETWSYAYDPLGARVAFTHGGVTTSYLVDQGRVLARYGDSGDVDFFYVHGPMGLLYRLDPAGNPVVYLGDPRGSVVALTDASAEVVAAYAYDPYGGQRAASGSADNEFRFLGRHGVISDGSGLCLTSTRAYHPGLRRFMREDPLGLAAGPNPYAYGSGDPVGRMDPSGLVDQDTIASVKKGIWRDIAGNALDVGGDFLGNKFTAGLGDSSLYFMNWKNSGVTVFTKSPRIFRANKYLAQGSKALKFGSGLLSAWDFYDTASGLVSAQNAYAQKKQAQGTSWVTSFHLAKDLFWADTSKPNASWLDRMDIQAWDTFNASVMTMNSATGGFGNPAIGFSLSLLNNWAQYWGQEMVFRAYSEDARYEAFETYARWYGHVRYLLVKEQEQAYLEEQDRWLEENRMDEYGNDLKTKP